MQSIQIKYLPATNTQPARLKATCEGGSIIEPCEYLEPGEQALNLAIKLSNKLNWNVKEFARGSFKNCDYFNIIKIISKEHMNKENQIKTFMSKENQDYLKKEFDKFKNANCLKIKLTGWKDSTLIDSNYLTISKEQLEQIKEILINSN